ncbi:MAG: glycosyltransferase [Abditibacteriales bacterium]|nr:glycosyltransferase [Abditibacteriales bacterium]MDW8368240.1 glycosyltransferase [Abditibacteriales bacterium]
MRVAYVSDFLTVHDERFLRKLSAGGYDTTLVTFYPRPQVPKDLTALPNVSVVHHHVPPYPDPPTPPQSRFVNSVAIRLAFWRCFSLFRRALREFQPDVVHAGWVTTCGLMSALSGVRPFLLMPWGSDVLLAHRSARAWMKLKWVAHRADRITCDCLAVKERLVAEVNYPAANVLVAPWGIDLRRFRPHPQAARALRSAFGWEDKKVLIMTRGFEPIYGIEDFLASLPEVLRQEPDTRVILVGRGSLEPKLRGMVEALGLRDCVHFAGFVPNAELPYYLSAADVYVSTSLSDGTSLSLLEGMACALPVVVTDVPANLEWVQDGFNGYVAPRHNSRALAACLVKILQREEVRHVMGQRNFDIAQERANWDENFRKIEGLYRAMRAVGGFR